jgi:hypothetical protein
MKGWLALLVIALATATTARGATPETDEVLLLNGDRLSGKLVSVVGGKVKFDSPVLGELEFDAKEIGTLTTVEPQQIHTADGGVIVDAARAGEAGSFRTAGTSTVGEQVLALAEVTAINPPVFEPEWKGTLLGAAKFDRGNTHKNNAHAGLEAKYERERDAISFRARYTGERVKDTTTRLSTTTDRNLFGGLGYDFSLTEKAFWFAESSGEKDGPKDLDLRFIAGSGLGYRWFNRDDFKLSARAGLAWTSENYSSRDDDDFLAGLLGWDLERLLLPRLLFFHHGSYLPSIEDFGDRELWKTETGLRADLTADVFLEAKVLWELDTEPASGAERQDTDYILGLGYKF